MLELPIPPRGVYVQTGPPGPSDRASRPEPRRPGRAGHQSHAADAAVLGALGDADTVKAWASLLPLAAGGAAIAIWTARGKPGGAGFGNVLGSGIHGWFILWGLIFLGAFALPPVVAALLRPGSPAQLAIWSGWLLIVLAWQISDSPTDGARAAYGLFLTWIVWLLVALGTVALALRGIRLGGEKQAPRDNGV